MQTRTSIYTNEDIRRVENQTGLVYTGNLADTWGLIPIFLKPAPIEDRVNKVIALNKGFSTRAYKGESNA